VGNDKAVAAAVNRSISADTSGNISPEKSIDAAINRLIDRLRFGTIG
jgi:hypothetical protein